MDPPNQTNPVWIFLNIRNLSQEQKRGPLEYYWLPTFHCRLLLFQEPPFYPHKAIHELDGLGRHKYIVFSLPSNRRLRTVPRHHDCIFLKNIDFFTNGSLNGPTIASPKVRPPNPPAKQGISRQQNFLLFKVKTG